MPEVLRCSACHFVNEPNRVRCRICGQRLQEPSDAARPAAPVLGIPFEFYGWKLHRREVRLRSGETVGIYFFSRKTPKYGAPVSLPEGETVCVDAETGIPNLVPAATGFVNYDDAPGSVFTIDGWMLFSLPVVENGSPGWAFYFSRAPVMGGVPVESIPEDRKAKIISDGLPMLLPKGVTAWRHWRRQVVPRVISLGRTASPTMKDVTSLAGRYVRVKMGPGDSTTVSFQGVVSEVVPVGQNHVLVVRAEGSHPDAGIADVLVIGKDIDVAAELAWSLQHPERLLILVGIWHLRSRDALTKVKESRRPPPASDFMGRGEISLIHD